MRERNINEQRVVCKSARCAERKAACRNVVSIQSRGVQSAEYRGFPHTENRRAEARNEAGFITLAEKHTNGQELRKTENSQ